MPLSNDIEIQILKVKVINPKFVQSICITVNKTCACPNKYVRSQTLIINANEEILERFNNLGVTGTLSEESVHVSNEYCLINHIHVLQI